MFTNISDRLEASPVSICFHAPRGPVPCVASVAFSEASHKAVATLASYAMALAFFVLMGYPLRISWGP